jgi:hypothetical protein
MPLCEAQLYYLVIPHNTFLIDGTFVLYRQMYVGKLYSLNQRSVLLSRFGKEQSDWMSKGHLNVTFMNNINMRKGGAIKDLSLIRLVLKSLSFQNYNKLEL